MYKLSLLNLYSALLYDKTVGVACMQMLTDTVLNAKDMRKLKEKRAKRIKFYFNFISILIQFISE